MAGVLLALACEELAHAAPPPGGRQEAPALRPTQAQVLTLDVTAESGQSITSRATGWRTVEGDVTVEHLAGTNDASHLVHFFRDPIVNAWRAEDLTALTGVPMVGAVTAWVMQQALEPMEHLAGRDPDGHVRVFSRSLPGGQWSSMDVTATTGRTVASDLTSWQVQEGPLLFEHLAGHDAEGNLLVFFRSGAQDWQVRDVSAMTGTKVSSVATSWQVQRSDGLSEYLAAQGADGRLTVFARTPTHDWMAQPTPWSAPEGVTSWIDPPDFEHLAGAAPDGTLFLLFREGETDWTRVDVTALTGQRAVGRPTAYVTMDGTERVEVMAARSAEGHLLLFWRKAPQDWQVQDLTALSGFTVTTDPESWVNTATGLPVEHLAARDGGGHLRVFFGFGPLRGGPVEVP